MATKKCDIRITARHSFIYGAQEEHYLQTLGTQFLVLYFYINYIKLLILRSSCIFFAGNDNSLSLVPANIPGL